LNVSVGGTADVREGMRRLTTGRMLATEVRVHEVRANERYREVRSDIRRARTQKRLVGRQKKDESRS